MQCQQEASSPSFRFINIAEHRTAEEVEQRLDRLIQTIVDIQKPFISGGGEAADVLVVCLRLFRYPYTWIFTSTDT